jgi:hypothetical protein
LKERTDMTDAAHLRRQAELCLAIAELLSNPVDAKHARSAAEQYAQRARNAEQEQAARDQPSTMADLPKRATDSTSAA